VFSVALITSRCNKSRLTVSVEIFVFDHWLKILSLGELIINQSINHSICIRRRNLSVEITSWRRWGEQHDQSRVNRWVFRARENCSVEVDVLTFGGSQLHVVAAATANARSEV